MVPFHLLTDRVSELLLFLATVADICLGKGLQVLLRNNETVTSEVDNNVINVPENKVYVQAYCELVREYYWTNKIGDRVLDGPSFMLFSEFVNKTGVRLAHVEPTPSCFGANINGTYIGGALGMLQSGEADVTSIGFFLMQDRYEFADFTAPIFQSPYCIVMPRAPLVPFTQVLLLPYQTSSWAAILGCVFAAVATWHLTQKIQAARMRSTRLHTSAFVEVVRIVLTGGGGRKTHSSSQSIVLCTLLIFSLILGNAYQGQLLGFLTAPPHLPEPETLEAADQSLGRIFTYSILNGIFDSEDTRQVLRNIRRKFLTIAYDDLMDVLVGTSRRIGDGVVITKWLYSYYSKDENLTKSGEGMLHLVPECINPPGYLSYLVRKNSSLFVKLAPFVLRVLESGLFDQWQVTQRQAMVADGTSVAHHEGSHLQEDPKLAVEQMAGLFVVLAVAWSFASAVFVVELLYFRWRDRKIR